jgi:phosphoglycolate phosphatase
VIELAVVDLAGTTVQDDGAVEGAFIDALAAVDAFDTANPDESLLQEIRSTMGMSKISVFRVLLGDEARAQAANTAFEAAYARRVDAGEVTPLPHAEETLQRLRDEGVRVSLTTGFSAATRDLLLGTLGWSSLADLALSPDGELRGRPAPDLVLASVIRLGVDDVRSVAVVGDTFNDLLSGARAGASVLAGVLTGAHDAAMLAAAPHTHLLDSIGELPAVLRGMSSVASRR